MAAEENGLVRLLAAANDDESQVATAAETLAAAKEDEHPRLVGEWQLQQEFTVTTQAIMMTGKGSAP